MISCNVLSPQFFWFKWCRQNIFVVYLRLHLREHRHVVRALRHYRRRCIRDFLPSNWGFSPDLGRYLDVHRHVRFVPSLFLLFMRFLPMIAISEVKGVTPQANPHHAESPEIESTSSWRKGAHDHKDSVRP